MRVLPGESGDSVLPFHGVRPTKFDFLISMKDCEIHATTLGITAVPYEKLVTSSVTQMFVEQGAQEIPDSLVEAAPRLEEVPLLGLNREVGEIVRGPLLASQVRNLDHDGLTSHAHA
jgi:hypothetical protein